MVTKFRVLIQEYLGCVRSGVPKYGKTLSAGTYSNSKSVDEVRESIRKLIEEHSESI